MGTWGPGLYSNDIAKDLKSTIAAVSRLPLVTDELVGIITSSFPEAANDAKDEDHTTFWLVLADQFHRKGIESQAVFDRAIEIIDSGKDLEMPAFTEMGRGDQQKRETALSTLRDQLAQPVPKKTRKTLQKPQPLILEIGDVIIFPIVDTGGCFNPYSTKTSWTRADWGAATIIDRGHAFGFLSHYTPVVVNRRLNVSSPPTLNDLAGNIGWRLARPGTCSKTHFQRMQIEPIGKIDVDSKKVELTFPERRDGKYAAVNDISISNSFYVFSKPRDHDTNIDSLSTLRRA
jgi:hypothetical protein